MIAEYENDELEYLYNAPRAYGLTQNHKHLKEMKAICGLDYDPVFVPVVCDFYSGMQVTIPLHASQINGTLEDIKSVYAKTYTGGMVSYEENADENGFMSALALEEKDTMQVSVYGNADRFTLIARYDNLGKGASGSAIQNMNILLGLPDDTGLEK
jgi:N-acetyl-gamma-glutamyl-phosphate reductase